MHYPRCVLLRIYTHASTHAQKGGKPHSVVAYSEVVWFGPDDLHYVLIELGLFPLSGKSIFSFIYIFWVILPHDSTLSKAHKIAYQGCTKLFKIKHFILVLFSQFFPQNDGFLPHL